jgi:arsenate reductase (thioredoxin)
MTRKMISIGFLCFLIFMSVEQTIYGGHQENKKIILFVCEHGAARSTIAAAYFNKLVQEQGLNYVAIFRGTDPDTVLTLGTATGLVKDGFDTSGWVPKPASTQDINAAYKTVTFDCVLPVKDNTPVVEKWDGIPPISKNYDIARNQILEKINQLITQLRASKK